ncbi:MAG: hypothetical protein WC426_13585 [Sulfuriferula sp.]
MKVNLNNLYTLSGDPRDGNALIEEIDGLGAADVRTSSFLFSGRDGGLVTDQFYGFRNITVSGKIISETCEQHQIDRDEFLEATPIGSTFPVYVTNFVGQEFLIYCNVIKPVLKYGVGGMISDFMLQLTAGDPLFYNTDGGGLQSATVQRVTQGGYVTPYDLPVDWASGSNPTVVVNSGNAIVYPVITLNDSAINPIITNQTTGESFELVLTMVDGDEVIIDMLNRTVTINGSNIIGNRTDASTWWGLAVGNNSIVLDSDSGSDNVEATVTWRNGVTGI